uniref:Maturase K n=1 Tax=Delavayella serrata TaxID=264774 RepID=A0A8F2XVJ0_9MARC|nr:maturase K [Delavayella serrata]
MEDKFNNSTICLDTTIPYSLHPETLIRLFRRDISDTSFLHFLRLLLHQNENIAFSLPEFFLRKNEFYNLLWNFQIHKFEYSLINIWKQFYHSSSTLFWFFIDRTSFVQKIRYICEKLTSEPIDEIVEKTYLIHYARYQNTLVVSTNGNLYVFVKNWNLFLLIFWEKYFHLWFEPYRVDIKDLSKKPVYFLGYLLRIRTKNTLIQIKLVNHSIDTNFITQEFCTIVPIVPLIRLLAKEKFCNISGRPVCRVSWTTLTDHEIFQRFDQIIRNIFFYYSGSIEKKGLYQLHYILRFSCAKTLACKHKSNIRTVWKKYGSNLVEKSIYLKKPQSISWRTYEKKFWYLNIIQINSLVHFPQKFKSVTEVHR